MEENNADEVEVDSEEDASELEEVQLKELGDLEAEENIEDWHVVSTKSHGHAIRD